MKLTFNPRLSFGLLPCVLAATLVVGPLQNAGATPSGEAPVTKEKSTPSAPTDADIFRSHAFEEPLVPIGVHTTPAENLALSKAIALHVRGNDQDDYSAILSFLREFPHSPWRAAILTNVGVRYRQTGWFLKSLAAWKEAWELSKDDTSQLGKPLADRAIGELAELNTAFGRKTEVEKILKELGDRPLMGPATEKITAAREGLWMMRHEPENVFRCGPLALARIATCNKAHIADRAKILSAQSTDHGMSLEQVWRLSREAGMNFQMAKRESGSDIIAPSIVNWKTNHFAALVQEDHGKFLVQDPISNEHLLVSKAALDAETSGYFLVPDGPLPKGWSHVSAREGRRVWGAGNTRWHDTTGTKLWDDKAKCPSGALGMATYNFHTQLVSLNIMDTPVGYTPPRGPDMHFTITYNQRERIEAGGVSVSNFTSKWVCNWIAYVQATPYVDWPAYIHLPGGGTEIRDRPDLDPGPDRQSGATLTLVVNPSNGMHSYARALPDGSRQLFDLLGNDYRYYMTKWIDPTGNTILFNYLNFRLNSVTDALGQVTTIEHRSDNPQNVPDYYLIKKITDPFGRYAMFDYNSDGRLWRIHDAIGIVSEFHYEAPSSDFVDTMITPYETTNFSHPPSALEPDPPDDPPNARIIQAVDASTGATERVEFGHLAPGIAATETTLPVVPGITIFNGAYHLRNSFYWDKRATALYPPQGGVYDYTKAKLIHWLHYDNDTVSNIKEREKMPLENAVYYFYPGQPTGYNGTAFVGNSGFPSNVARVLDDNTTQLSRSEYNNTYHKLTKSTDAAGRVTSYEYAPNYIDLISVFQANPNGHSVDPDGQSADLTFSCTYNGSHQPLVVTDAAGQTTQYSYTASKQLETVTNAKSEITRYEYGDGSSGKPLGYLTAIISPMFDGSSAITSFTYDGAHRVQTVTAIPYNYTMTTDYDNLDRPTQITYPDGTTEQFLYTDTQRGMTLDLTASKDRLDRWTYRHYDSNRQMDSITDPLTRVTQYGWCTCGALTSITDPKFHVTTFVRDLQSRVTSKIFGDGSGNSTTVHYTYESATSRLKSMTDALNQTTNYQYRKDNNLEQISYTNAQRPTPIVNFAYDSYYNRVTSMATQGIGTTNYTYYSVGSAPTLGANKLQTADGPFSNETITYGYDELGRVLSRDINGTTAIVEYDSLDRLMSTRNALGRFDRVYDDVTPRLQTMNYPSGQTTNYTYFGNNEDRRLQTLENVARGGATLSKFDYTYDAEGQIMNWSSLLGTTTSGRWFEYDDARQLLGARNAADSDFVTQRFDYVYDKAGNRTHDAVTNFVEHLQGGIYGMSHDYTANAVNQIDTSRRTHFYPQVVLEPAVSLSYDATGNMTYDGGNLTFEWDAANRLSVINHIDSGQHTEFAYDGLGRRVKITEYGPGVTATIQPSGSDYTTFNTAPFTLPAGSYTLTFEGLTNGGDVALIDAVSFNNTLANGSFESPDVSSSTGGYEYAPRGATWSFISHTGIASNGSDFTARNLDAPDGQQVAFLQGAGRISQTCNVSAGTYTLSFKWPREETTRAISNCG